MVKILYGMRVSYCMIRVKNSIFSRPIRSFRNKNFARCLEILNLISRMAIRTFQQIVVKSTRNYPINYPSSYPRTNHLRGKTQGAIEYRYLLD